MGIENPIRRRRLEPTKPAPKYVPAPAPAPTPAPATPARQPEKVPA